MTRLLGSSLAVIVLLLVASPSITACSAMTKAAQQDPMKCERDPKCEKRRGRTADCSRQCNDDPACMNRCEQVQAPNGGLGH